jgi:V8-like Glu-specific endopeptidase
MGVSSSNNVFNEGKIIYNEHLN